MLIKRKIFNEILKEKKIHQKKMVIERKIFKLSNPEFSA
jgi:hypothetical protein